MSAIPTVEATIVTRLLDHVSALNPENGGTCRGVADIQTFINSTALPTPAAIVVFYGESAAPNLVIGSARQETSLTWDVFVVSRTFNVSGEGRAGAYQLIEDVIAALQGFIVSTQPLSKLFYVDSSYFAITST